MSSKDTKETNVLAQASILMVAGIVTRIIGVLYRSPVTSIIGDEGNGYYSIAVNIYTMILLISSYSIPMAVSKVVSAKMAVHQYKIAHKVFKCALIYVLVIGGIASLITFFGASVLIPSNQPKAIPVLRILAPTIFFSGFLGVLFPADALPDLGDCCYHVRIPRIFPRDAFHGADRDFSDCRAGG